MLSSEKLLQKKQYNIIDDKSKSNENEKRKFNIFSTTSPKNKIHIRRILKCL